MNNHQSNEIKLKAVADGPTAGAPGEAGCPAAALPCLYYDNCIQKEEKERRPFVRLTPSQKKMRAKVIIATEWMVWKYGLEKVGLLTLSFGVPGTGRGSFETWELRQQAKEWEFVQSRWHSYCTNVVADRYADWVCVFERHRDGVWHIHVVVVTKADIRTGTDIETLSNYKLPYWMRRGKHLRNEALAAEWKELRLIACRYRFGRVELLPVKKTGEAMGVYLGKYLIKTYQTTEAGQRRRLVRFSKQVSKVIVGPFTVLGLGSLIHRTRLAMAARMLNLSDYGDFAEYFGSQWNHRLKNTLLWIPMPFRFRKGDFASGVAARVLKRYAEYPKEYLEEAGQRKIDDAARELWRMLEEGLEENSEALMKIRARRLGDNFGDGPATAEDRQDDLFADPLCPF